MGVSRDTACNPKHKANVVRMRYWPPQANIKQSHEPVNQSSTGILYINSASSSELPTLIVGHHANAEQCRLGLWRHCRGRANVRPLIPRPRTSASTGLHITVKAVATSQGHGAAERGSCIDAIPFVACRIEGCWRQATLWSTIEQRPYCVMCWNNSAHHVTQDVKLNYTCSHDEERITQNLDNSSRPRPDICGRLRTGRSLLGSAPCADYDARRLCLVAVQGCRARAKSGYPPRRRSTCRPIAWRDPIRDVLPNKLLVLAGPEPSYTPSEFAVPASGYTTLFEPPTDATIALYKAPD